MLKFFQNVLNMCDFLRIYMYIIYIYIIVK